jgi:hypothetical protein
MGHINTTSLKKNFGPKSKRNKDLVVAPPKTNITKIVTSFIYPKLKVKETVSFPS